MVTIANRARRRTCAGVVAVLLMALVAFSGSALAAGADQPRVGSSPLYEAEEVFALTSLHVHGSSVVELPNGDILACWFEGSGERQADDVAIKGARKRAGERQWSAPFVLADTPGFPDINPVLFVDPQRRLWLFWYTVIANQWETSLLKYRISYDYTAQEGPPVWAWQDVLHVKPGDPAERGVKPDDRFVVAIKTKAAEYAQRQPIPQGMTEEQFRQLLEGWISDLVAKAQGDYGPEKMKGYAYFRRMGWQTRNKPVVVDGTRLILPLYSDGFSIGLMAITEDWGNTWSFSEPLVGGGSIQPAIARKADGTLVAYMRDNGPAPKRLHISESRDGGLTWSPVQDTVLPNPGSAADIVTLSNGHWLLVYNDLEKDRHSLAVSISPDEGQTWPWTRHLELDTRSQGATSSHYPAVIEAKDGTIHVVYSYHHNDRQGPSKTIKHVRFDEAWVMQGDQR